MQRRFVVTKCIGVVQNIILCSWHMMLARTDTKFETGAPCVACSDVVLDRHDREHIVYAMCLPAQNRQTWWGAL